MADGNPVPVEFIDIVDGGDKQSHIRRNPGAGVMLIWRRYQA